MVLDSRTSGSIHYYQIVDGLGAAMGFDLFVHCFRDGQAAPYDRRIAEDIFDRDALEPSDMQYVKYRDGRGEIYGGKDGEDFDGFMLSHFGGTTICERVLEIADVTRSLIFWPSTHILFAVTDYSTLDHVPDDIKNQSAKIALVKTVDQLWAAINAEEGDEHGVQVIWPIAEGGA